MGMFDSYAKRKKKSGKAARLRKMISRIKKLEKKAALEKDLKTAIARLKTLSK